ncbi:hypothetical protein L596_024109 [Steinernema carpocapsae]|uniref:G-protein coupled receptors family 1 profile domain-containing protein n=1 Tax=Steinernema carpocapsae TaxID=34508 RepID=A0A4U5MFQ9_STECR|nr:hypothetical protein L596_024109 [Steinernema carpocapsae]
MSKSIALLPLQSKLYVGFGSLAVLLNFPIVLVILLSSLRKRKEFITITGFCLVGALSGLTYASLGLYRLLVFHEGKETDLVSRRFCSLQLSQNLSIFCNRVVSAVVFLNAVDRFLAVIKPIFYFRLSTKCAVLANLLVFLHALIPNILSYALSQDDLEENVSIMCFSYQNVDQALGFALQVLRIASAFISILLYVPVTVKLFQYTKSRNRASFEKLTQITITAMITSLDAVVILIPDVILACAFRKSAQVAMGFYNFIIFKNSLNAVIYVFREG